MRVAVFAGIHGNPFSSGPRKKRFIPLLILFISFGQTGTVFCKENQVKTKIFQWKEKNAPYRTFENCPFSVTSTAYWIICNKAKFAASVGSTKRAEIRLDEIISPAIHNDMMTHKIHDLLDQNTGKLKNIIRNRS